MGRGTQRTPNSLQSYQGGKGRGPHPFAFLKGSGLGTHCRLSILLASLEPMPGISPPSSGNCSAISSLVPDASPTQCPPVDRSPAAPGQAQLGMLLQTQLNPLTPTSACSASWPPGSLFLGCSPRLRAGLQPKTQSYKSLWVPCCGSWGTLKPSTEGDSSPEPLHRKRVDIGFAHLCPVHTCCLLSRGTPVSLRLTYWVADTVLTQDLGLRLSLLWGFMPFSECPLGVG